MKAAAMPIIRRAPENNAATLVVAADSNSSNNLLDLAAKRSHSHVHPGALAAAPAQGAERRIKHGTQNR
jgi:hypothetical protein